jgi:hypothetical protein
MMGGAMRETGKGSLAVPLPPDVAQRDVFVLSTVHWASASFIGPHLMLKSLPTPRSVHSLNQSPYPSRIQRVGERELLWEFVCGEQLLTPFEKLMRDRPLPAGFAVDVGVYQVTVEQMGTEGPTRLRYRFTQPLSDAVWLVWNGASYQRVDIPAVGGTLSLPAIAQGLGQFLEPAPVCAAGASSPERQPSN